MTREPSTPMSRLLHLAFALALCALPASGLAQTALPSGPKPAQPAKRPTGSVEKPSLEKINAYFNGIAGLSADFVQTSSDGRRFTGKMHLLRPGRLRFEYAPPAALEVVADGRSVAIRDRKVNTQDVYFIGQTPLKFLLAERIDIARDSKVVGLALEGEDVVLTLEDRQTIGGTSRIRVMFDGRDLALRQWTVTDPQGFDTTVRLANTDFSSRPDQKLFYIEYAIGGSRSSN